jgi:hypothetical protein
LYAIITGPLRKVEFFAAKDAPKSDLKVLKDLQLVHTGNHVITEVGFP